MLIALLLLVANAAGQGSMQVRRTINRGDAKPQSAPVLSKEEQQRVTQLLEQAEAGSASLDAASRIISYTELARAYQLRDRAKTVKLLETALASCRELQLDMPNPRLNEHLTQQLQQRVIPDIARIAPESLDAQVDELPGDLRNIAVSVLIPYYGKTKQLSRARDLVMRVAQESEMPYDSAMALMRLLKDRPDEVRSLFVSSLSSFENQSDPRFATGGDFPDMIVAFHEQIPDQIVEKAIDSVLSQAKKSDEKNGKMQISMASSKGATNFNSSYEYRLFQLAPILKKIDHGHAESLMRDQQDVLTQLTAFPEGKLNSGDEGDPGGTMMMRMGNGPGQGPSPGPDQGEPSLLERQRMAQVMADAAKHPQDAMANAAMLAPMTAVDAYMGIAQTVLKTDPTTARAALGKARDLIDKLPLDQQMMRIQDIAATFLQMDDRENSKKTLEKALSIANQVYKNEAEGDDPNTAPKAYWESTNGFRSVLSTAQKLDGRWAATLLKEIPDDGIRVFNQIAMANAMLGIPARGYEVITATKNGGMKMMMTADGN